MALCGECEEVDFEMGVSVLIQMNLRRGKYIAMILVTNLRGNPKVSDWQK